MNQPKLSLVRKCPRCGEKKMFDDDVLNSLSKTHKGVKICNDCGTEESLTLQGFLDDQESKIKQIRWENWNP